METKIKIIIVEDEVLIAQNLAETLEDLGYEVVCCCYDFDTATQALSTADFDLAMLDINIDTDSQKSGLVLAKQVLVAKQKPFIFLTAFDDKATILEASKLKPAAYLLKPPTDASLFATIQTAIENFQQGLSQKEVLEKPRKEPYFFSKIRNKLYKIYWKEVHTLISTKNYVEIYCHEHEFCHLIRGSLKQIQEQYIPDELQEKFLLVNRSTLIDPHYISMFDVGSVSVKGKTYEISKSVFQELQMWEKESRA